MIKKIIFIFILSILFIDSSCIACSFNGDIQGSLESCFGEGGDTTVVTPGDLDIENGGGFSTIVLGWVDSLAGILYLFAIGAVAYGSLMFTLSAGQDEKITKAKDIIKWGIIGFLGVVSANALITLIIQIIYDL